MLYVAINVRPVDESLRVDSVNFLSDGNFTAIVSFQVCECLKFVDAKYMKHPQVCDRIAFVHLIKAYPAMQTLLGFGISHSL